MTRPVASRYEAEEEVEEGSVQEPLSNHKNEALALVDEDEVGDEDERR